MYLTAGLRHRRVVKRFKSRSRQAFRLMRLIDSSGQHVTGCRVQSPATNGKPKSQQVELPPLPKNPASMAGPTPWCNWVIRGQVLAGAYPASTDDRETDKILTILLEHGGVCLPSSRGVAQHSRVNVACRQGLEVIKHRFCGVIHCRPLDYLCFTHILSSTIDDNMFHLTGLTSKMHRRS